MIHLKEDEKITQVFDNNAVVICFAADDNYVPQTAVMINSIISNASENHNYDIIILTANIGEINEQNTLCLGENKKNISIRFFDINEITKDLVFFTKNIYTPTSYSKEAYFRLFIPFLMPEYKKVIYLDGDMAAIRDVSPLADIDLDGYTVAATRDYSGIAACYDANSDRKDYRTEIGITDLDKYFISSLVIFNIEEFNKKISLDEIKKLISFRAWRQHDQDILNVICKDSTLIIDARWSFFDELNYACQFLPENLSRELIEVSKDPYIIHYAAERKAWRDFDSAFNKYFWQYAYKTRFFDMFNGMISGERTTFRYYIFKTALNRDISYYYTLNDMVISSQPYFIGNLSNVKIVIEFIKKQDDKIIIDGYYEDIDISGKLKLDIYANGDKLNAYNSDIFRGYGNIYKMRHIRAFNVSFKYTGRQTEITFRFTYNGRNFIVPHLVNVEQFCPINETPESYYVCDDWILTKKNWNTLLFEPYSKKQKNLYEKNLSKVLKRRNNPYFKKLAYLRRFYKFSKNYFNKRNIWLISDELESVDEQTLQLFKLLKNTDGITPYLVVGKDCKNMKKLKRKCNIVIAKSKKHKLLYMFSNVIISSSYKIDIYKPCFDRSNEVRDMIANKCFIYWHKRKEELTYNVKPFYAVDKFIFTDKEEYNLMKKRNNGYTNEQLYLLNEPLERDEYLKIIDIIRN